MGNDSLLQVGVVGGTGIGTDEVVLVGVYGG